MFQLVIAIITIALIAFLALTNLYYGGDAFSAGSLRAGVTTLVNGGQQIDGAAIIYKTDMGGIEAKTVAELVTGVDGLSYLASPPGGSAFTAGNAWRLSGSHAVITLDQNIDEVEVCKEVARQAQNTGQFFCGDAAGNKLNGAVTQDDTTGVSNAKTFSYVSKASNGTETGSN